MASAMEKHCMVNDTAPVAFLLQRIQWSMWLITAANKQGSPAMRRGGSFLCVSPGVVTSAFDSTREHGGLNMDTEGSIVAEERRVRKLQEIRQLLSIALGPDVDLNQEAKNPIAQWRETAAMEISIAMPASRIPRNMQGHSRH